MNMSDEQDKLAGQFVQLFDRFALQDTNAAKKRADRGLINVAGPMLGAIISTITLVAIESKMEIDKGLWLIPIGLLAVGVVFAIKHARAVNGLNRQALESKKMADILDVTSFDDN